MGGQGHPHEEELELEDSQVGGHGHPQDELDEDEDDSQVGGQGQPQEDVDDELEDSQVGGQGQCHEEMVESHGLGGQPPLHFPASVPSSGASMPDLWRRRSHPQSLVLEDVHELDVQLWSMTLQRTGRRRAQLSGMAILPSAYKAKHSSLLTWSQEAIQAERLQSRQSLMTWRALSMFDSVMSANSRPIDSQAQRA